METRLNLSGSSPTCRKRHEDITRDTPPAKKQKVDIACDFCRNKKIKCDGIHPVCGSCQKRKDGGARCTWIHGLSRKDAAASRESILRIEKRLAELNDNLYTGSPSIQSTNYLDAVLQANSVFNQVLTGEHTKRNTSRDSPYEGTGSLVATNATSRDRSYDNIRSADADNSTISGPTSAMIGPGPEDEQVLGMYGSSSAGNFISQVRHAVEKSMVSSPLRHTRSELNGEGFLLDKRRDGRDQGRVIKDYDLPSRKRADDLMIVYWNAVHPLYPFVDKVETTSDYDRLWTGQELHLDEGEFLCIINVIFAITSQLNIKTSPEERKNSSNIFFQRAQEFANLWKPGTLQTVQSFLLFAQYLQSTNEPHQCWMFAGHAVRTAESLGLHLPETSNQISNPRKRETVRRVWHGCVLMDRVLAMTSGRPTMISRSVATAVPLPIAIDDEDLPYKPPLPETAPNSKPRIMFFIQSLKLYSILYEILVGFYAPDAKKKKTSQNMDDSYFGLCKSGAKEKSILDIDRDLMNWEEDLPSHLKSFHHGLQMISQGTMPQKEILLVRQAVVLRQRFLHVRLLSLRPILSSFVISGVDDSGGVASFSNLLSHRLAQQCSVVCVKIAQEAIELVERSKLKNFATAGYTAAWWYNILFCYSAATVLIAARLKASIVSELGEESIVESWELAMKVLEGYIPYSDSIPKLLATLRVLFDQVPIIYSHHRRQIISDHQSTDPKYGSLQAEQTINQDVPLPSVNIMSSNWSLDQQLQHTQIPLTNSANFTSDETYMMDMNGMAFDPNDLSWLDALPFEF